MPTIKLLVDSGCDATPQQLAALGVDLVPLIVTIEDQQYRDFYEIDPQQYYDTLKNCQNIPTTAQPSPATFIEYFEKYMADYQHILVITMSVGGSGTYNSAVIAKGMFEEAHPNCGCQIHIHDSWSTSLVELMQLELAKEMIDQGESIEAILSSIDALKRRTTTFYLVDDIKFLVKGGRVSNLKGSVISTFHIKPIIAIIEGHGTNHAIAMGYKNGIAKIASSFLKEADEDTTLYISHCGALENAQALAAKIKESYPDLRCMINPMYATMATHSGPGTIGVFYERTK